MKSLLLGSAATLVVVAGAQAADLPTKKGAPAAEYVKVCKIGNIAGFIIPGTDTCLKISGLVTARFIVGATHDVYSLNTRGTQTVSTAGRQQNGLGDWTRERVVFDAVSNTAYGPLIAHAEPEFQFGHALYPGYASTSDQGATDKAWISWAGITAGKHESFFVSPFLDFGMNSDSDISGPDYTTNTLAYTASFGGGFSATIAIETPTASVGSNVVIPGSTFNPLADGTRAPNLVAALDVTQGWGSAHIGAMAQQIRAQYGAGVSPAVTTDTWGWAVTGGVAFNLPSLGAGADVKVAAAYGDGALGATGAMNPWNINIGVTNNGPTADIYYDAVNGWEKTKAWTVGGGFDIPIGPQFKVSPEASYAHASIDVPTTSWLSKSWTEYVAGGTLEWDPVKNLSFRLDLLYENLSVDKPQAMSAATPWKKSSDGFWGEFIVERDF